MIRKISFVIGLFLALIFSSGHLFAQSLSNVEALILREEYSQAARECEKILTHRHQSKIESKAHYLLGICLLKEAKFDQARENFNIILRRFPRSKFCDDARLGIADSYFLSQDYKQASIKYEEFIHDFPRSQLKSIARRHQKLCKQAGPYASSYFSVQAGCFGKKGNAEKLRDKLIDSGFQAYIVELPSEALCRVRVGRFSNRLQAESLEQRLKSEGYPTKICP